MSIKVNNTIDIETESTNIPNNSETSVSSSNSSNITPLENTNSVDFIKNEYSIVGDAFFASINTEEAPQWLLSIIDSVVDTAVGNGLVDHTALVTEVQNAIDALVVAKNQYTEEINTISIDLDTIVTNKIETYNATVGDSKATKVEMTNAVANLDFVLTQDINNKEASLTENINTQIANVSTAYADADSLLASDIDQLTATFVDQGSNITANADAVSGLQTHIGVDSSNVPVGNGILSRLETLEHQNDGVVEFYTGEADVMINVTNPDANPDDDELDVTAEPYSLWIPIEATVPPSAWDGELENRVYKDTVALNYYEVVNSAWAALADEAEYLNKITVLRDKHVGDVYIKYNTSGQYEKSYKFIKTAADLTNPFATDAEGYTWALITDTVADQAYALALEAKDLADGKRRVFTAQPTAPYDVGDLWVDSGTVKVSSNTVTDGGSFNSGHWSVAATDDTEVNKIKTGTVAVNITSTTTTGTGWDAFFTDNNYATKLATELAQIATLEETNDGVVEAYYSPYAALAPTDPAPIENDYYFDGATLYKFISQAWTEVTPSYGDWLIDETNKIAYRYQDTDGKNVGTKAWRDESTSIIGKTYLGMITAQATADGIVVTFAQDEDPTTNAKIGDVWIDTANKIIYVHDGSESNYWIEKSTYLETSADIDISEITVGADTFETYLSGQITDNSVAIYSGSDHLGQTTANVGDIYIESSTETSAGGTTIDVTKTWKVNTLNPSLEAHWDLISNNNGLIALQDTADGKRTIFTGDTDPDFSVDHQPIERDLWIPSVQVPRNVNYGMSWPTNTTKTDPTARRIFWAHYTGLIEVVFTLHSDSVTSNVHLHVGDVDLEIGTLDGTEQTFSIEIQVVKSEVYEFYVWADNGDTGQLSNVRIGFYEEGEIYQYTDGNSRWVATTTYTENLNTFANTVNENLAILENQVDGKIEHTFYDTYEDPDIPGTPTNETEALGNIKGEWTTDTLRQDNHGNTAYFKDSTNAWWYNSNLNTWESIVDTSIYEALQNAATAQSTVDGKLSQFYAYGSPSDETPADISIIAYELSDPPNSGDYTISGGEYVAASPPGSGEYDQVITTTIPVDSFNYWFKTDLSTLHYANDSVWTAVPTTPTAGVPHISEGDTVTVYDATTKDTTVYTYLTGSWAITGPNGIISNSSYFIDLHNEVTGPTGIVATSISELEIASQAYTDAEGIRVEDKFEYDAKIRIGGDKYYSAGFGLVTGGETIPNTPETAYSSEFWINAEKLRFTNSNKTGSDSPFTIDTSGASPKVTFVGQVSFGSGQTGTIDEAVAAVVDTVAVGDKNINITDNLIPITSLVVDTNNSGYQLVGDPVKSSSAGIDNFSESQLVLDADDEAYSPYVDELVIPYYYRFGIKGLSALVTDTGIGTFKIVTIDAVDAVTESDIVITLDEALVNTDWYIIDGIINPNGGDNTSYDGSIRNTIGTKIGTVQNFALPADAEKLVLGWKYNATISRMKLAKISADTATSSVATTDYVDTVTSNIDVSSQLPFTVSYTTAPDSTDLVDTNGTGKTFVDGCIWRQINLGISNDKYLHYVFDSNNTDKWTEVGGTYINGSNITTGTIDADLITAGIITKTVGDKTITMNLDDASFSMSSGTSGARMELNMSTFKIYDTNNVLRVHIGDLSL